MNVILSYLLPRKRANTDEVDDQLVDHSIGPIES